MTLTIGDALSLARETDVEKRDAEILLCHVLGKARTYIMAFAEQSLSAAQSEDYQEKLARRKAGEPIAYIIGEREFWSLPIKTTPATLIPRPDTEVLVETVLNQCSKQSLSVVDLGTGTGAIALALKSERPMWSLLGVDRIEEAVSLARENAECLSLDVCFQLSSWCEGLESKAFDVIVSNPPYIDINDHHLNEGDVRFEPKSALVANDQGLADIRAITEQALRCLKPAGRLFFEHGWLQGTAVAAILDHAGFKQVTTVKDYAGNDRVTFGQL
ncbi:peptide chain release factor N(5)-glutamine methyltransferase [Reinekea forsetii]|nr:peptide chain release factor N(5)-glutamine methyltransferase [Reinekea forsetii]